MFRKLTAILLCIAMILCLSACSKKAGEAENPENADSTVTEPNKTNETDPADKPDESGQTEQGSTEEEPPAGMITEQFWGTIKGAWYHKSDDGPIDFAWFGEENGEKCFSGGYLNSGYIYGGTITEMKMITATSFEITVYCPAVAPNELDDGHDEYTFAFTCQIDVTKPDSIFADNIAGPDTVEFVYLGNDLSVDTTFLYE